MGVSFANHINRDLMRLARRQKSVYDAALMKAAKVLADELEANTPKQSERGGQIDRRTRASHAHMQNNVVFSLDEHEEAKVLIGYTEDVAWRAHFPEFGTIKQQPQGFMERTTNASMQRAVNVLENELRRGLGLSSP